MVAGTFSLYDNAEEALFKGQTDRSADVVHAVLVGSGYTPAVATDATYANISANEVTGTDDTSGGRTLVSEPAPIVVVT